MERPRGYKNIGDSHGRRNKEGSYGKEKFSKVFFKFLAISIQITFFFLAVNIDKFLSLKKVFNPLTIGKK
ncbi:MAG: hypothetical protein ACK56F_02580 [bacterium]